MTSTPSAEVPPDASAFPFADLLADLRRRGFGIALPDYKDVAKLASRWQGVNRATFRDAMAALLARNADEVERIRVAFDEWAGPIEDEPPALPPPPPKRPKLWTWHITALVLVAALAGGIGMCRHFDEQHRGQPAVQDVKPRGTEPITTTDAPTKAPDPPPAPFDRARELPWIFAAVVAIAALLALAMREVRRRQKQWTGRYWNRVLSNERGPHQYESNVGSAALPFPRAVLEEVATILGRARDADPADADVLDVEESLRRTLHAGMAPHLVFAPPPRNVPVLVLQDVAWQMRPWQAKVDAFVGELKRQGVELDRWYFDGDPLRVSRAAGGPTIELETLALSRSEASLLILSSGQGATEDSLRALDRVLKKWSFRTWIQPIGNPQYWRRELQSLPVRVWPMTPAGVRAAAVGISRKGDPGVAPAFAPPRDVTRGDVERMKQLLALAPNPSLELAGELRRRFCPEVPEEVLLFLGATGVFHGATIAFPPEQMQQLLAASARDPERECQVRRYLLEVLRESRPPEDSAAHLRWQLDEAVQRLKLDPGDGDARATIGALAAGPLHDEVRRAVELHGVDVTVRPRSPNAVRAQGVRPPVWAWPRLGAAAVAVGVLVPLTVLATRAADLGQGAPIPHQRGAYTLTLETPTLIRGEAAVPNVPKRARIYRDGALYTLNDLDLPLTTPVPDTLRGRWIELRARLPRGNYAMSYPLWVPRTRVETIVVPPPVLVTWPDDDVSRRVVRAIVRFANVPEARVTRDAPITDLTSDEGGLIVAVGKEFGMSISGGAVYDLRTPGRLADYVREQPPPAQAGTVVLTFVTPDGAPLREVMYVLRDGGATGPPGLAGRRISVEPGTYQILILNTPVVSPNLGTIRVVGGQTTRRQLVIRLREQWQHDELSRRVVKALALALGVDESAITPSEPRVNSGKLAAVQIQLGFSLDLPSSGSWTPQQLVDVIRALEKKPVPVVLTWVTTRGASLVINFEISGGGTTFRGVAGASVLVPPGDYTVTAIDPRVPVGVERIAITPRTEFRQQFIVEVDQESEVTFRKFTVVRSSASGEIREVWSNESGEKWVRVDPRGSHPLTFAHTTSVNGISGIVILEPNGRQFFIPDAASDRQVLERRDGRQEWRAYGVIATGE